MEMTSHQFSPPNAKPNSASEGGCAETDFECRCRPALVEELDKSSVIEMVEGSLVMQTPRDGAISCASTVSGASSPLAFEPVHFSPYLAPQEPVQAAALAAALANVPVDGSGFIISADVVGPQFEPLPQGLATSFPMNQIHEGWAPHRVCKLLSPSLQVKNTFVEYKIQDMSDSSARRRSLSVPASFKATAITPTREECLDKGFAPLHFAPPLDFAPTQFDLPIGSLPPPPPQRDIENGLLCDQSWDHTPNAEDGNMFARQLMDAPVEFVLMPIRYQGYSEAWPYPHMETWLARQGLSQTNFQAEWKDPDVHDRSSTWSSLSDDSCRWKEKGRQRPSVDEKKAYDILDIARGARPGNIWDFAERSPQSSMDLQRAMDIAADSGYRINDWDSWVPAYNIAMAFSGDRIKQAYESPQANYALSHLFETMPTFLLRPIVQDLQHFALEAAKHRYGCRCMIRFVRYHADKSEPEVAEVVHALLSDVLALGRSEFGTHVVQEILRKGLPEHRQAVVSAFRRDLLRESKNRFTFPIIEEAFRCCEPDLVKEMLDRLLSHKDGIRELVESKFGVKVVQAILNGPQQQAIAEHICAIASQINHSGAGRFVLQEAHKIMSLASDSFAGST